MNTLDKRDGWPSPVPAVALVAPRTEGEEVSDDARKAAVSDLVHQTLRERLQEVHAEVTLNISRRPPIWHATLSGHMGTAWVVGSLCLAVAHAWAHQWGWAFNGVFMAWLGWSLRWWCELVRRNDVPFKVSVVPRFEEDTQ